jgi:hypothetical protein
VDNVSDFVGFQDMADEVAVDNIAFDEDVATIVADRRVHIVSRCAIVHGIQIDQAIKVGALMKIIIDEIASNESIAAGHKQIFSSLCRHHHQWPPLFFLQLFFIHEFTKGHGKKKKEISTGIGRFPVPKKYYLYFLFVNK